MRTQHTWRNAYADICLDLLEANPNISSREIAQQLDLPLDLLDEIVERIRPTQQLPIQGLPVRLGRRL